MNRWNWMGVAGLIVVGLAAGGTSCAEMAAVWYAEAAGAAAARQYHTGAERSDEKVGKSTTY